MKRSGVAVRRVIGLAARYHHTMASFRTINVRLPANEHWLDGILFLPPQPPALVVQLERSRGTMEKSRGAFVAEGLREAGFAVLQLALLTHVEERKNPEVWQQVATLAERVAAIIEWVQHETLLQALPLGIATRDAATAAVIRVAAREPLPIRAIASRGGRPDLAGLEPLRALHTPLLLLTGELDESGPIPNTQAYEQLSCERKLLIIPGASHAFEEIGTLEHVTQHIVEWLRYWLVECIPKPH